MEDKTCCMLTIIDCCHTTKIILQPKLHSFQGRRQKNFRGEGATEKIPKNSTIKPFNSGGGGDGKNSKKRPNIALLSLYLLYLYHV